MPYSLASYVKAFLKPTQRQSRSPPDFGYILYISNPDRELCFAADFLYHLLDHSEAPDILAVDILNALSTDPGVKEVVDYIHPKPHGDLPVKESIWVSSMLLSLPLFLSSYPKIEGVVPAVNHLAAHYMVHLCLLGTPT
ncbi:hypothetical protein M422DRAFT_23878 [Sphaerobolus stellatus SS14]|nr:hypothetical protein M422DRAFT_23878 [Sphaerobolus stellatus SS14]